MKPLLFVSIIIALAAASTGCNKKSRAFLPVLTDTTTDRQFDVALENLTRKLQLPSIRKGADSFEYRFWLAGDGADINLVRIRFTDSAWVMSETLIWCHIPEYEYKKNDTVNHLLETIVDSTKTRSLTASISTDDFIDSLQSYKLEQAPLETEILHSFNPHMDGINQTIEIADKTNHRIFIYPCPIDIKSLKDFHNQMRAFFRLLHRKLAAKFIPC